MTWRCSGERIAELTRQASGLLRAVVADDGRLLRILDNGDLSRSVIVGFFDRVGVEERFSYGTTTSQVGLTVVARLGGCRVRVRGTRAMALVALAALHGPQGEHAQEVLALASVIHAEGLAEVVP